MFAKFIVSSLSSCALDLALFTLFCGVLKNRIIGYAAAATVLARVISAISNYCINHRVVFRSTEKVSTSAARYFALAVIQAGLSAAFVTWGITLLPSAPETAVKLAVDTVLFVISYIVQHKFIFLRRDGKAASEDSR